MLADFLGERDDARRAARGAQHLARRRDAVLIEKARHGAVGGDHQVLDQFLAAVLALPFQVAQRIPAEHRMGLERLERQRAMDMALGA